MQPFTKQEEQDSGIGVILTSDLKAVLDVLERDLLLVRRKRDREFVKLYTERWLVMFPTGELVGVAKPYLTWDERALLATIIPLIDYETNIVLSPRYCFDEQRRRQKRVFLPATEEEIALFAGKDRAVVRRLLRSLEEKGVVSRLPETGRRGGTRAVRVSTELVFKGSIPRDFINSQTVTDGMLIESDKEVRDGGSE